MIICKQCGIEFLIKARNKCHTKKYCSYLCYKKTDEFKNSYKIGYLKNRNIKCDFFDNEQVDRVFHELRSEDISKTQSKRVATFNKVYGGFSEIGKKGCMNRRVKFLLKHGIISHSLYSKQEIDLLFLKHFNTIENHGDKIKKGIRRIHGTLTKQEYQRKRELFLISEIEKQGYSIDHISPSDLRRIVSLINKRFAYKDVGKWKRSNVENNYCAVDGLSDDEVNLLYSQYIIERMSLVDTIHNGYKNTKKGWYDFSNINYSMFFRSSWEQMVLESLDRLLGNKVINNVSCPCFIYYEYDGLKRKYYPDIKVETSKGDFVLEIKPDSKTNETKNVEKFKAARNLFGDKFIILTEKHIFSEDFERKLLEILGDKV